MKRRLYFTEQDQPQDFQHLMNMYGLQYDGHHDGYSGLFDNKASDSTTCIHIYNTSEDNYAIVVTDTTSAGLVSTREETCYGISNLIDYLDFLMNKYEVEIIDCSIVCDTGHRQAVLAAISTRDLSKNLVRVKSSNVWAYTINIRNNKDKTGDVLCQFKGSKGGPGDIYIYYDVPIRLWQKWLGAPSKGSFFWRYIRNNFYYSKLTGDKKGKLKNAVN